MAGQLNRALQQMNLAQRFMLATFLIMVAGMFGISNWVGQQIEAGVIHQDGSTAALLLDSFISPQLQDYGQKGELDQHSTRRHSVHFWGVPRWENGLSLFRLGT